MSTAQVAARLNGRVKWMNVKVGYGMIVPAGGGEDVFFHRSELKIEGFAYVPPGVRVTYEQAEPNEHDASRSNGRNNGLRARSVQLDLD
jgi:cold shock CspA family protein